MSRRTYHTQKQLTEQVLSQMTDAQWQEVIDLLPADASQQAFLHHAFSRARGLSEKGARSWARRTRQSSDWLLWMVQSLLVSPAEEESLDIPRSFTGEIHLLDATHLRTWKRSGDSRRLHWSSTPLLQADGTTAFDLSGWLTGLSSVGQGEANVVLEVRTRQTPMRLVALGLSEAPATRARRKRRADCGIMDLLTDPSVARAAEASADASSATTATSSFHCCGAIDPGSLSRTLSRSLS